MDHKVNVFSGNNNCCRTCMVPTTDVISLFDSISIGSKNESLDSILLKCTSIKVTETDIYPLGICRNCVAKLIESFLFFQKCYITQGRLEQIFKKDIFNDRTKENFYSDDTSNEENLYEEPNFETTVKNENTQVQQYTNSENPEPEYEKNSVQEISSEINDFQENHNNEDPCCANDCDGDIDNDSNRFMVDSQSSNWICENCGKVFKTQYSLQIHRKSHKNLIGNLACSLCGKKFTRATDVKRHMSVHTGARPYPCPACPKSFTQSGSLAKHVKKHEEYKVMKPEKRKMEQMHFLCSICGKSFKQSSVLTVHMRRHSGDKPHCCTICERRFVSSCKLTVHMRFHTGEKPFICKLCGKCFRQSTVLKKHIKSHSSIKSYQCSCCSKSFSTSYYLNIHMRNHTGERPFKCSVCLKSFSDPKNLKQHEEIHSGEKPYLCVLCGKKFQRSHHLKNHMKTHLKKKK